jgi:predicted Zn-dependent peptidase
MSANEVSFPIELYMDDVLYNHMPILDIKSRIEKMHSITLDTLNKFIERYINFDNLLVVCVGNTINKSQICKSLQKHKLNFKKIDNK